MINLLLTLIFICIFIIYSYIEGKREAWYYYIKGTFRYENIPNEHKLFSIQRGLFISILSILTSLNINNMFIFKSIGCFICYCLIFSFIHDGAYYLIRNNLNYSIYPKRWWDQKSEIDKHNISSAIFDPKPITRTIMFIIGICILIVLIFLK